MHYYNLNLHKMMHMLWNVNTCFNLHVKCLYILVAQWTKIMFLPNKIKCHFRVKLSKMNKYNKTD